MPKVTYEIVEHAGCFEAMFISSRGAEGFRCQDGRYIKYLLFWWLFGYKSLVGLNLEMIMLNNIVAALYMTFS